MESKKARIILLLIRLITLKDAPFPGPHGPPCCFYIYQGFTRKIGIKFKVAALSSAEMQPMYQKLNYLMSNLMPDYGDKGIIMRGPFVKMTVGNWLDGQDGILNSINYNIPNDSPWEIGLPATGIFDGAE